MIHNHSPHGLMTDTERRNVAPWHLNAQAVYCILLAPQMDIESVVVVLPCGCVDHASNQVSASFNQG
jgi:hypothetical protein